MVKGNVLPFVPTEREVFIAILLFRVFCCAITRTNFHPDEYFQALEPAFHVVYGVGVLTWEWSRKFCLRSYVGLLPYIGLYQLLNVLGIDSPKTLYILPRVLQCLCTIMADWSMYRVAKSISRSSSNGNSSKEEFAAVAVLLHLSCWSVMFCSCRTLANTTEASLLMIGIYLWTVAKDYYPHEYKWNLSVLGATVACFSCYTRPTALLAWIPLTVYKLSGDYFASGDNYDDDDDDDTARSSVSSVTMTDGMNKVVNVLVKQFAPLGIMLVQTFILVDTYYYKQVTFTPYNFYWANVYQNMASLFGTHPWHWNFTNGLPTLLGASVPLVVYGIFLRLPSDLRSMSNIVLVYVVGLSVLSSHQEVRFLLPCLPVFHMVAAYAVVGRVLLSNNSVSGGKRGDNGTEPQLKEGEKKKEDEETVIRLFSQPPPAAAASSSSMGWVFYLYFVCTAHVLAGTYLLSFHQAGTEKALQLVARDINTTTIITSTAHMHINNPISATTHVLLAAPCYTFPGYAYIHSPAQPVQLYMPDCQIGGPSSFDAGPLEQTKQMMAAYQLQLVRQLTAAEKLKPHPAYDFTGVMEAAVGGDTVERYDDDDSSFVRELAKKEERDREVCESERVTVYLLTFDSYSKTLSSFLKQHNFELLYGDIHHAHFPYDLDDPFPKLAVEVYKMQHPIGQGCN